MTYSSEKPTYLFRVELEDDARKLDADNIFTKLGERVYLREFSEKPEAVYQALKEKFGIVGPVHWVELPKTIVTDGVSEPDHMHAAPVAVVTPQVNFITPPNQPAPSKKPTSGT